MPKAQVTLEWSEDLGEYWINPDNLNALLYGKTATRNDLLKVVDYEHVPDPVPKYQVCQGSKTSKPANTLDEALEIAKSMLAEGRYNVLITLGACKVTRDWDQASKSTRLNIDAPHV